MDQFMRTGEYRFFEKFFDIYSFEDESLLSYKNQNVDIDVIKFENFQQICYDTDKFNKSLLVGILEKIRRLCRDKLRNKDDEILINRQEFFTYIEIVVRDNDKSENENDPELKEIFECLAIDNIIYKKKFIEILNSFELPLNVDNFLSPLKKKEEITFFDFCSLFNKKTDTSAMVFSTFYSSFYNTKDILTKKGKGKDNFPIKFNVKEII